MPKCPLEVRSLNFYTTIFLPVALPASLTTIINIDYLNHWIYTLISNSVSKVNFISICSCSVPWLWLLFVSLIVRFLLHASYMCILVCHMVLLAMLYASSYVPCSHLSKVWFYIWCLAIIRTHITMWCICRWSDYLTTCTECEMISGRIKW